MSPASGVANRNAIERHAQAVHDAFERFGTDVHAQIGNAMMQARRCIATVSSSAARLADRLSVGVHVRLQAQKSQWSERPSMAFAVGCISSTY
jgi:hypothetical protein